MADRTQYDPEAERRAADMPHVVRYGTDGKPTPVSLPDRWEQQNGPRTRAIGGAIDAVKHARRADWTLDQLVEKVRAHWALVDGLEADA